MVNGPIAIALTHLEIVDVVDDMVLVSGTEPPEDGGLPARRPLRVRRDPLLVLGGAVLARRPMPDEVDLAEAAAAQLLDHPVLGAQLGQRPVEELHPRLPHSLLFQVCTEGEGRLADWPTLLG